MADVVFTETSSISASDCKELSGETLSFHIFHPDFDSVSGNRGAGFGFVS
jgi:hypothetical protein